MQALHKAGHEVAQLAWFHRSENLLHRPWQTFTTYKDHKKCCGRGDYISEVYRDMKVSYLQVDKETGYPQAVGKDFPYCPHGQRLSGDIYGQMSIDLVVSIFQPEIVISIGDQWMCASIEGCIFRGSFKHVMYAAVDGAPLPRYTIKNGHRLDWRQLYLDVDYPVTMCNWAAEEVDKMVDDGGVACKTILHGVDTDCFHPLSSTQRTRIRSGNTPGFIEIGRSSGSGIWDRVTNLDDDFLVLYVGRNMSRKSIPFLFRTIRQFKDEGLEDKDKVRLLLHMPYKDVGWNMDELIRIYDAYDWVMVNPQVKVGTGPDDKELNKVYNMADVSLHMSSAEGFALTLAESLSAGVPTTALDYSAPPSWGGEVLQLIRPIEVIQEPVTNLGRAVPDIDDAVKTLKRIYDMPRKERIEVSKAGRRFMVKGFNWKGSITPSWVALVDTISLDGITPLSSQDMHSNQKR